LLDWQATPLIASLNAVRAELVEAPFFFLRRRKKERPFDKLRANGLDWWHGALPKSVDPKTRPVVIPMAAR
jgi:hypothetical protein